MNASSGPPGQSNGSIFRKDEIRQLKADLVASETKYRAQLQDANKETEEALAELELLQRSLAWQLIMRYRAAVEKIASPGTLRGRLYSALTASIAKTFGRGRPAKAAREPTGINTWRNLILPAFPQPEASIIIPAHNHMETTHACLLSVMDNTSGVPYEVILVDDASSDGTGDFFKQVQNLKVVINQSNLGFVHSCNKGASLAQAPFLVFLNNDTRVRRGWLGSLLEPIRYNEKIGLVGAKLLYPDERLQEAGTIVWCDGSGWNYGRGDDPGKAEYNYLREVDYCSGSCLLVRAELFKEVGGFDVRYAPAYYEDTDLAFSARKLGYKVIYQPRAEVIHDEGLSHGTDISTGHKRWQEINRQKFVGKWRPALERQPLPGSQLLLARERLKKDRILVIDATVPTYDRDSGSLRMDSLMKLLVELNYSVTFIPDNGDPRQPYTARLQDQGIEVLYGSIDLAERIRAFAADLRFCIASRPSVAWRYLQLIREYAPECKFIYDTVDLHFVREQRRADCEGRESLRKLAQGYRELELALVRASDATFTVCEKEKEVLLAEVPNALVNVVPNIHQIDPDPPGWEDRRDLIFLGGFTHPPNIAAVHLFVKKILPVIKESLPEVKFYVVGSNPPPDIEDLAGPDILVTGYVEDLSPYLRQARVLVSPLTFGAGLKGKITQSLSHGLAVVTTSIGAEGTELEGRDAVLVADQPVFFAHKVVELYRNRGLWEYLVRKGIKHAQENYSFEVVKEKIEGMFSRELPCASPAPFTFPSPVMSFGPRIPESVLHPEKFDA